jgi:hypothetical protein
MDKNLRIDSQKAKGKVFLCSGHLGCPCWFEGIKGMFGVVMNVME